MRRKRRNDLIDSIHKVRGQHHNFHNLSFTLMGAKGDFFLFVGDRVFPSALYCYSRYLGKFYLCDPCLSYGKHLYHRILSSYEEESYGM